MVTGVRSSCEAIEIKALFISLISFSDSRASLSSLVRSKTIFSSSWLYFSIFIFSLSKSSCCSCKTSILRVSVISCMATRHTGSSIFSLVSIVPCSNALKYVLSLRFILSSNVGRVPVLKACRKLMKNILASPCDKYADRGLPFTCKRSIPSRWQAVRLMLLITPFTFKIK